MSRYCPIKYMKEADRLQRETGKHHDVIFAHKEYFILPDTETEKNGYIPEQDVVYSTMITYSHKD